MGVAKKQISVTVMPEMSPRIENWLAGREVEYEVEVVRTKKQIRLKIISLFAMDERGQHQAEMYGRFLERIKQGGNP